MRFLVTGITPITDEITNYVSIELFINTPLSTLSIS